MSMTVESKVTIYEVAGEDTKGLTLPTVKVESHWNRDEFVVITVPGAKPVTVVAADLRRAIDNGRNWR